MVPTRSTHGAGQALARCVGSMVYRYSWQSFKCQSTQDLIPKGLLTNDLLMLRVESVDASNLSMSSSFYHQFADCNSSSCQGPPQKIERWNHQLLMRNFPPSCFESSFKVTNHGRMGAKAPPSAEVCLLCLRKRFARSVLPLMNIPKSPWFGAPRSEKKQATGNKHSVNLRKNGWSL